MSFIIRTLFPIRCAALRHVGPHSSVYQTWYQQMIPAATAAGLWPAKMQKLSIFEMPEPGVPAERSISYAALQIGPKVTPPPPFEVIEIPGGEYIGYNHDGPPESLAEVWPWFWQNAGQVAGRPVILGQFFETYFGWPIEGEPVGTELNLLLALSPPVIKKQGLFGKLFGQ